MVTLDCTKSIFDVDLDNDLGPLMVDSNSIVHEKMEINLEVLVRDI